jgi:hypothetical protein
VSAVSQPTSSVNDTNTNATSSPGSIDPVRKVATQLPPESNQPDRSLQSTSAVTYITMGTPPAPTNVPSLLFPGGAVPTSLATDAVIPMATPAAAPMSTPPVVPTYTSVGPAPSEYARSNFLNVPQKRAEPSQPQVTSAERYFVDSTVPMQSGGMV